MFRTTTLAVTALLAATRLRAGKTAEVDKLFAG